MIDDKGRLFGKVNIIDLAVVVLLGLGVIFYASTGGRALDKSVQTAMITIKVDSEQLHAPNAEDIKPGDEIAIWNGSTTLVIGKVDNIEIRPYPSRAPVDGKLVVAPDPIQRLATITITGPGIVGKHNISMNNQVVLVGTRFTIRSEKSHFLVAVREMSYKEAPEGAK